MSKIKHGIQMLAVFSAAALALTGCTPGPREEETEAPETELITEAEIDPTLYIPIEQTETEPETEPATEPATETEAAPQITIEDIQPNIQISDYSGTGEYEVYGNEVKTGTLTYQANADAFYASFDDGSLVYAGSDKTISYDGSIWEDCPDDFANLWELARTEDCELMPQGVMIDGTGCYHLTATYYDDASPVSGMIEALGRPNAVLGPVSLSYYVTADTYRIVRIDMVADFQTTENDKTATEEFTCSISCTPVSGVELQAPETEAEEVDTYVSGNIDSDKNLYYNNAFDLQVSGKDAVDFDINTTRELDAGYQESGSSYTEEAYASGSGTILNISSLSAKKMSISEVLDKYLGDSGAVDAEDADSITVGKNTYSCTYSTINNTQTKTYCTITDGRALIMTLYYNDYETVDLFESHLFSMDEDATWEEDSWILGTRYTITTPYGYSLDETVDNNDLYVCMKNGNTEVNAFVLEGETVDGLSYEESLSTDELSREVIVNEDVNVDDGSILRYMVIKNAEAGGEDEVEDRIAEMTASEEETEDESGTEEAPETAAEDEDGTAYYTYIGLIQKDTAVIEFYAVSVSPDLDYESTYVDFSNNISVSEYIEETLPEEEYDGEDYVDADAVY